MNEPQTSLWVSSASQNEANSHPLRIPNLGQIMISTNQATTVEWNK